MVRELTQELLTEYSFYVYHVNVFPLIFTIEMHWKQEENNCQCQEGVKKEKRKNENERKNEGWIKKMLMGKKKK